MITREFLHLPHGERETVPISSISEIQVSRKKVGDYRQGAALFFLLGILSIWFSVGFVFIVLGIAAWNTNIYQYNLSIVSRGETLIIATSKRKGPLKDIARTIHGVSLSKKILHTFVST